MEKYNKKISNVVNPDAKKQFKQNFKKINAAQYYTNNTKTWSIDDDKVLEEFLYRKSNNISNLLERFSPREIRNRADFLGIKLHSYREPLCENDKFLCIHFEQEECFKKLLALGFKKGEIYQLAEDLGVKEPLAPRGGSTTWSKQEIEILNREFPIHGANIEALKNLGRSYSSIMIKAKKEGLIDSR